MYISKKQVCECGTPVGVNFLKDDETYDGIAPKYTCSKCLAKIGYIHVHDDEYKLGQRRHKFMQEVRDNFKMDNVNGNMNMGYTDIEEMVNRIFTF